MTENINDISSETLYQRSKKDDSQHYNDDNRSLPIAFKVASKHRLIIMLCSLLVTAISILIPVLEPLATNVQSLNLYIGQMVLKGQMPYSDILAPGGFLYYLLIAVSFALGSKLWLLIIQFLSLYVSGIYFYKLVTYYTNNQSISLIGSLFFSLAHLSLGFGGLYPIQWAMPFILLGLWFVIKYIDSQTSDEQFIGYGLTVAIALLIEPRTLFFWIILFIGITGHNISQKIWARGFYQNLATLLGLLMVFYLAGYFIFNMELLLPYLSQTIIQPFTKIFFGTGVLWQTALIQLSIALLSGCLLGIVEFIEAIRKNTNHLFGKLLLISNAILYLVLALFSKDWNWHQLLFVLPFGLLLTIIRTDTLVKQQNSVTNSHRRKEDEPNFLSLFLKRHLGGPIIIAFIAIGLPVYFYFQNQTLHQERELISQYIKEHTANDEPVIIIDSNATIYQQTRRASATHYPVSTIYLSHQKNQHEFEDELLENESNLIVISNQENLSDDLKRNLSNYYLEVTPESLEQFTIYRLK